MCGYIIAQREHRHWSAWFSDALDQLVPVEGWERGTDLPFSLATDRRTCPDCGGSGQYVGLQAVETCRTCGGRMTNA